MLSLAQSFNSIFCLEWIPSESGPKILQYKKNKVSFDCTTYKNFLTSVLSDFSISSSNESKVLSLSLDIENVGLTSFKYDNKIPFEDYIQWYEEKILGTYIMNNYDIFYYKLYDTNNIAMVVYLSKEIKKNIRHSCDENSFKIKHLGVDIFSANISLNQFYKLKKTNSYILWKVHKNNIHYITYFKDGHLTHYMKIRISKNITVLQNIGSKENQKKIVLFLESLLANKNESNTLTNNIYIYQTKTDSSFIKKMINKNKNIKLMDIGLKFLKISKKNTNYSLVGFNENGNSLKGIDV